MTPQETVNKIMKTIDDATNAFIEGLKPIQEQSFKKVIELVKELDIDSNGNLKNNLANLKVIGRLPKELENVILSEKYIKHVSEFINTYNKIQKQNNDYFKSMDIGFKEKSLHDEIKKNSVNAIIDDLTEQGITANYIDEIILILNTAITSGSSYSDLVKQLQVFMLGDGE